MFKLGLVVGVIAIAIGAMQMVSSSDWGLANASLVARAQVSPEEITRALAVLPETKIENYEWVHPLP